MSPATTIDSVIVEDLQLCNALRAKQVQIVKSDQVSDPHMLVGDNTWQEFCSIVCKIFIHTL